MAVLGSGYPDIVSYFPFNKGKVLDSFQTHGEKLAGQPWMSTDFNLLLGYNLSKTGHDATDKWRVLTIAGVFKILG